MRNFLRRKSMWSYVTGCRPKPFDKKADDFATLLDVWEADNAKMIT